VTARALLFAAVAAGGTPSAADADPLAPVAALSGACWLAPFPGGKVADLQCFEPMEGGHFVRARHIVLGSDPAYSGETIYYVDGASRRLAFVYFTSLGGVSRGQMLPQDDGALATDQVHVAADGSEMTMQTEMRQPDADHYRSATRRWANGAWTAPFTVEYRRLPRECATWETARIRCGTVERAISATG
jgi:hypothetical protein